MPKVAASPRKGAPAFIAIDALDLCCAPVARRLLCLGSIQVSMGRWQLLGIALVCWHAGRMKLGEGIAALLEPVFDRLGFLAVNAPAFFGPFTRHADIAYGSDPQHRLDVYVPDEAAAVLSPVVVFWHGGHWRFGDKRDYRFVGAALAGSGFNAVLPNYRHYPQVKMPGFMDDAARAALWSAAHAGDYGGDHRRVFLMGHSAGAHLAALLTLDP